jgi:hypothetical protein
MNSVYRMNEFAKRVERSVQTDKKDIVVNCGVSGVVQKDNWQ